MNTDRHGLRRELKLWDLVSMQVTIVVWLGWNGFAAKQGSSQAVVWLLAIVLFYLPLSAVVIKLSRAMSREGGVYQWVRAGISPFAGYMAGWNLAIYAITAFAVTGSLLANGFAYAAGPWAEQLSASKPFALALTLLSCLIALVFNVRGLRSAKWWSQAGAVLTVATFLIMFYLLIAAWEKKLPTARYSFSLGWPSLSILTLSVFTKMAISALSGFDSSAVFAEECRKPENDVAGSVLIAAPLIALMYILGTSAVLAYIAPADVDLAATIPQLITAGFGASGAGRALTLSVAVAFAVSFLASMVVMTGAIARLPMVAGWDRLLPRWWSELHPSFRTPAKAIGVVTGTMMLLGVLSLLGAGNQEAVQVGIGAGGGSLCIMYMMLFAVVLIGFGGPGLSRPGFFIRLAAFAAFLVALAGLIFQIVPVGEVANRSLFGIKVAGTIVAANAFGAYFLAWRQTAAR